MERTKRQQVQRRPITRFLRVHLGSYTKREDTYHATRHDQPTLQCHWLLDLELRLNSYYTVLKPSIIESLDVLTYCIRIQFFHSSEHVMRVILICFLLHKGERNIVDDVSLSYILRVRTYYFPSSSLVDCDIRHSPTLVWYWILKVPTHKTALATIFESIFQFFFYY